LKSTFDDLGPLDGGHIFADLVLLLCYQVGRQRPLSAHHPMLRVRTRALFADPVALLRQPLGRWRPYKEFSSTENATLPGQEEKLVGRNRGGRDLL